MKRKIVQHGNTSLTISLPIKWVKEHGLQKGDEIEIDQEGNTIQIRTNNEKVVKSTSINISNQSKSYIKSIISNVYKKGYDKVSINFENPESFEYIKNAVEGLLGFEIIHQSRNSCTIESVAAGLDLAFDNMLRKSFQIVNSTAQSTLEDTQSGNLDRWDEISAASKTLVKFTDFCKRQLNKKAQKDDHVAKYYYLLVWDLEKIANEMKYIYRYLKDEKDIKLSKEVMELFEQTTNAINLFYETFYKQKHEKIDELTKLKDKLIFTNSYDLLQTTKQQDSIVVHHLANAVRRTYELGGPYFGIHL